MGAEEGGEVVIVVYYFEVAVYYDKDAVDVLLVGRQIPYDFL